MNKLYGGMDLHANNPVTVLVDEEDPVVYEKRLPNDLGKMLLPLRSKCSVKLFAGHYTWVRIYA